MAFMPSFEFPLEQLSEAGVRVTRALQLITPLTLVDLDWLIHFAFHLPYITRDEIVPFYQSPAPGNQVQNAGKLGRRQAIERLEQLVAAKVLCKNVIVGDEEYELSR